MCCINTTIALYISFIYMYLFSVKKVSVIQLSCFHKERTIFKLNSIKELLK